MKIETRINGKFVSPGERLGVIEEFLPGTGIYDEDGNLYSLTTGHLLVDLGEREISVRRRVRSPLIPKRGDIVVGQANSVQDKTLSLKISQIGDAVLSTPLTGIMHISDVSRGYVKTMRDAFKPGDTIRARVISTANREYHLSTQEDRLGVIRAVCSRCGGNLVLQRNRLRCLACGRFEERKFAFDYGKSPS